MKFRSVGPHLSQSPSGRCRGLLKLTLVTEPVLNHTQVEMVRVNLDGAVKRSDGNGVFESRTQPTHEFFSGYRYANERTLASVLGKWYPVKSYTALMPRRGKSIDWRLDIEYLTRAAEAFPAGVSASPPSSRSKIRRVPRQCMTRCVPHSPRLAWRW